MQDRKTFWLLIFLGVVVFSLRLFLSFQTDTFTHESYFHIRQIEHIRETGLPLFQDQLSHGGTTLLFSPFFHYLFAAASFLIPLPLLLKILPQFFFVAVSIIIFFLTKRLVGNTLLAAVAAAFSAFAPIFLTMSLSSVTPFSLFLPLVFLLFYFFVSLREKNHVRNVLILIVLLSFVSPLSLFLIPLFWFYLLLLKLERIPEREMEFEVVIFATFFILLMQLIIFKKAILAHGGAVIFQNLPLTVSLNTFASTNILQIIYSLGLIPFLFGILALYFFSFAEKKGMMTFSIAFTGSTAVLLWLRVLALSSGLLFLSFGMSILAVFSLHSFFQYVKKTILAKYTRALLFCLLALFFLTSIFPALFMERANVVSKDESAALLWMYATIPFEKLVLAHPKDGFAIEYVAQRKAFLDENYLLRAQPDVLYQDMISAFTTQFETEAIHIFDRYGIGYIYVSPAVRAEIGLAEPRYVFDTRCFRKIYDANVSVYEVLCHLQ